MNRKNVALIAVLGATLSFGLYFAPADVVTRLGATLTGGSPTGGIVEEQNIDISVAEDPDAGDRDMNTGGLAVDYPLRKYWVYIAFVSAALVIGCLLPASTRAQSNKRNGKAHSGAIETEVENEPVSPASVVSQHSVGPVEDQGGNQPQAPSMRRATSAVRESVKPGPRKVTREQLEGFALKLKLMKARISAEFRDIHKMFQAVDGHDDVWTVELKGQTWYRKVDGKWIPGTPPEHLFITSRLLSVFEER